MKEDYLWDKTGNDAEIEQLENALQSFRYQESEPPILPIKNKVAEVKPVRQKFSFSFAFSFAACVLLILILVGIWLKFSNNKPVENLAKTASTPDIVTVPFKEIKAEPPISPKSKDETDKPVTKIRFVKKEKAILRKLRQSRKITPKNKTADEEIIVTPEEKEAFDQLMLALSITSEKLKLVRDKVNGAEYQTAVNKPKK